MRHPPLAESRRGFSLLLVLWFSVGIAALTAGAMSVSRDALLAQTNRRDYLRDLWLVRGCLADVRATADALLADTLRHGSGGARVWQTLGALSGAALQTTASRCQMDFRPAGTRLDINRLSSADIREALISLGIADAFADSLSSAFLDWRDGDEVPRPAGAETQWYQAQQRTPPRNRALSDVRELHLVKGWERVLDADRLFDVTRARVVPAYAPAAVIRSLPGIGAEAAARFLEMRRVNEWAPSWAALAAQLSQAAQDTLAPHLAALESRTVDTPESWEVRLRTRETRGRASFELVATIVRDSWGVTIPFMTVVWR